MTSFKNKHKGERAFIVGTGPSLRYTNLDLIKGELSFSMHRIAPAFIHTYWRPTYFFCVTTRTKWVEYRHDVLAAMMSSDHSWIADRLEEFMGPYLRSATADRSFSWFEAMDIGRAKKGYYPQAWDCDIENGKISAYGMTGFTCLRMADWMGVDTVYLLGMDLGYKAHKAGTPDPNHFFKGYEYVFGLPPDGAWNEEHLRAYKVAEERSRMKIVNCTIGGYLDLFPRMPLEEVV